MGTEDELCHATFHVGVILLALLPMYSMSRIADHTEFKFSCAIAAIAGIYFKRLQLEYAPKLADSWISAKSILSVISEL